MGPIAYAAIQVGISLVTKLLASHPKRPKPQAFQGWFCEAGRPIPQGYGVLFFSPNIVWWGNGEVDERKDGGSPFYYANMIGTLAMGGHALELLDLQWGGRSLVLEPDLSAQSANHTDPVINPRLPQTFVGDAPIVLQVQARLMFGGAGQDGGVAGEIRIYPGTPGQAVDPLSNYSMRTQAVTSGSARPGVIYLALGSAEPLVPFYWGTRAQPKELVAVFRCIPKALWEMGLNAAYTSPAIGHNANAMETAWVLFTDPIHGQGTPAARMDAQSFADCAARLQDEGTVGGLSVPIADQEEVQDVLDEIKKHVWCEFYQHPTTGLITAALARPGDPVTRTITPANGVKFTPSSTGWRGLTNQTRLKYRRFTGGTKGTALTETITTNFQFTSVLARYFTVNGRNLFNVTVTLGGDELDPLAGDYSFDPASGWFAIYRTTLTESHLGDTLVVTYSSNPLAMHLQEDVAVDDDGADQLTTGEIRSITLDYPWYTDPLAAQVAAKLQSRTLGLPLRSGTIHLDRAGFDLVPLERIHVIWPAADLNDQPFDCIMRVAEVATGELQNGLIEAQVIEDIWSEDIIPQLPAAGSGSEFVPPVAPAMAIACGIGGDQVRINFFPSDPTFSIELWEADDETGAGAVLLATLPGTTAFYDVGTDETKAHQARLVRDGYIEGPFTDWITCSISGGPPEDPTCTLPTYSFAADQTAGTVRLVLVDPQGRVSLVEFRHRSGAGTFTAWTAATAELDGSYLDTLGFSDIEGSRIEWRITYRDCDGNEATFLGGADFTSAAPPTEPPIGLTAIDVDLALVTAMNPLGIREMPADRTPALDWRATEIKFPLKTYTKARGEATIAYTTAPVGSYFAFEYEDPATPDSWLPIEQDGVGPLIPLDEASLDLLDPGGSLRVPKRWVVTGDYVSIADGALDDVRVRLTVEGGTGTEDLIAPRVALQLTAVAPDLPPPELPEPDPEVPVDSCTIEGSEPADGFEYADIAAMEAAGWSLTET